MLVFVESSGEEHSVDGAIGDSAMQAAVNNSVPGIDADCGGACSCATCHVYVQDNWIAIVGAAGGPEQDLLDGLENARPASRLSCQIAVIEEFDGLRLSIPTAQG
jgi:2Fe-2S ferredoxin